MWAKYKKNPEMKRNVRFDDIDMTFCLDVKFPGRKDWVTVPYSRALKDKKDRDQRTAVPDAVDDRMLSTADELVVCGDDTDETEAGGTGTSGLGGSVTCTSWRAPSGGQ